ncbi:Uncharacterised protein [Vibrio cholerae]|nr:Uncharacterised protein [Vibrio cholerae]CSI92946.1 Uncharacterised protein [Vibrio cholerae]
MGGTQIGDALRHAARELMWVLAQILMKCHLLKSGVG